MAYWQVRDGFNNRDIENIDKIQLDDILFLVKEGVFVSYGRCVNSSVDAIEVDRWENLPLEPTASVDSLERGEYSKKIAPIKNNEKIYELLSKIVPLSIDKLKKISVTNFRLIEELEIDFNDDVNVIIGNNGAGKTAILDAIALGFGLMVTHFPSVKGIGFSDKDLRINHLNKKEPFSRIKLVSTQNLIWDRIEKRDKSKNTAKYVPTAYGSKELETFVDSLIDADNEDQAYTMPLVIYYGTCRNCFDTPMRKVNFQKEFHRFDALSSTLKGASNFSHFFQWFDAMEGIERREIQERKDFDFQLSELQNIREAVKMVKSFSNPRVKIRPLRFIIDKENHDGTIQELQIEQLSAGYKAMLSMIMDISARMSQANPHLGNHSKAIILIDKLDLHLHPKWQQTILSDLKRTFPNAQFIVTTHSPQILSTVQKEKIFILEDGKITKPFDTPYAKRSIVALEDIMATNSMPPLKEAELLENYLDKIHQGDIDSQDVLEMRKELNQLYGANYQQLKIADMIINKYKSLRK